MASGLQAAAEVEAAVFPPETDAASANSSHEADAQDAAQPQPNKKVFCQTLCWFCHACPQQ